MKKLRKIRKNAKALSPVVASIILIAVTVAVSIAVAAWMGALTVGFMGSSSLTINKADFGGSGLVTLTAKNTGTKAVTVSIVKINNIDATANVTSGDIGSAIDAGATVTIRVTMNPSWVSGNPYKFDLYDSSGQVVGSYQATPPQ
jgi:flagellin-like protein